VFRLDCRPTGSKWRGSDVLRVTREWFTSEPIIPLMCSFLV
jgi:hypothetical protein